MNSNQTSASTCLASAQTFAAIGDYVNALKSLPPEVPDREIRNCRAVCLMRLGRYSEAIRLLRAIAVNPNTLTLRADVPLPIHVNFAAALAYGGQPCGALDVIEEAHAIDDPEAGQIIDSIEWWISEMNLLRRLDWRINRVAPKMPLRPKEPPGRFPWEIDSST